MKKQISKPAAKPESKLWLYGPALAAVIFQIGLFYAFNKKFPFSTAFLATSFFVNSWTWPALEALGFIALGCAAWLAMIAACFAFGEMLFRFLRISNATPLETITFSLILGFAGMGLLIYGIGFLGLYKPAFFWLIVLTLIALGSVRHWLNRGSALKEHAAAFKSTFFQNDRIVGRILLGLFILLPSMMAFVPEIFYDALVYHLGLPHLYLLEGRYVDTPFVHFSRFPQLMHMIYVFALGLYGEVTAKLAHVSLLLGGILAIHALANRAGLQKAGLIAGLFFISIPVVQMNTWTTAVDLALSSFCLGSMLAAVIWHQSEFPDWRMLLLCGILAGAAFGTKYTAAFFLFGMAGLVLISCRQKRWPLKTTAGCILLWGGAVTLMMLPWFARNAVFTGNPFYPFLSSIFESKYLVPSKFLSEANLSIGYRPETWLKTLTFLWDWSLLGPSAFDFLGPTVIAFLPLAASLRWPQNFHWPLLGFFAIFFITGFPLSTQVRYLLPGVVLMATLSGLATWAFFNKSELKAWSWCGYGLLGLHLASLLLWNVTIIQSSYTPAGVLAGKEPRKSYTTYYHPGMNPWPPDNIFPDMAQLPANARVIFLGEEKVFRCPRPYIYSNVYDKTPLVEWANESQSAQELLEKIKKAGATHILLNIAEAFRVKGYGQFHWTPQGAKIFREFWRRHVRLVIGRSINETPSLFLFAILEQQEAAKTPEVFHPFMRQALQLRREPAAPGERGTLGARGAEPAAAADP